MIDVTLVDFDEFIWFRNSGADEGGLEPRYAQFMTPRFHEKNWWISDVSDMLKVKKKFSDTSMKIKEF